MKAPSVPALLALLFSLLPFTACGGGGGGGPRYGVQLRAVGGLGTGQQTYEFQVTGASESSTLTYQLNQGTETPIQNRMVKFTGLGDGRYELLVRARDGRQFAEDRAAWVVDNQPPAPPTLASIEVRRTSATSAELTAFWEAPDDGSTLVYKLHYDSGLKLKIADLRGKFAVEGTSPLMVNQKPVKGRYSVRLTGLQPAQWYSLALEVTDAKQRSTMGPVTSNHSDLRDLGATYATTSQHENLRYGEGQISPNELHLGDFNGNGQVELLTVSSKKSKTTRSEISTFRKTSRTSNTWVRSNSRAIRIYGPFGTRMYDLNLDGRQDIVGYAAPRATYGSKPYLVLAYGRTPSGCDLTLIDPPKLAGYSTSFLHPVPGQFDGDGMPDIAVWVSYTRPGTPTRFEFRIYHGQGTTTRPTFTSASVGSKTYFNTTSAWDLTAVDLDRDGVDEILTTIYIASKKAFFYEVLDPSADKSQVLRRASLEPTRVTLHHSQVVTQDRDGDGDLDLLTSEYDEANRVYRLQEWKYAPKSGLSRGSSLMNLRRNPGHILLVDQGRDGIADLILHYGAGFKNLDTIAVHKGQRDAKTGLANGNFGPEELLSVSALGHAPGSRIAAADTDQDGYLDFVSYHLRRSTNAYFLAFWDSRARMRQTIQQRQVLGGAQRTRTKSGTIAPASLHQGGSRDILLGQDPRGFGYLAARSHAFKSTGAFDAETRIELDGVLPAGMEIETSTAADANGDGLSDLYFKSKKGALGLLLASKKGTTTSYSLHPLMTVSADARVGVARFTADKTPDFLVLLPSGTAQVFALSQRAGRWELSAGQQMAFTGQPGRFLVRDFNQDGFADIAAQTKTSQSKTGLFLETLFTIQASGTRVHRFGKARPRSVSSPFVSMDAGSFRYQSQKDILVLNEAGETWIYYLSASSSSPYVDFGSSRRIFTKSDLGGTPGLVQAIEFTNDGWSDIVVVTPTTKTASLYRNDPSTYSAGVSFSRRQTLELPFTPTRIRSANLNDDPYVDLILGDSRSKQFAFYLGEGGLR